MRFLKNLGLTRTLLAAAVLLGPTFAHAAESYIRNATVFQLRAYADGFGQCVAVVGGNINTDGTQTLTCPRTNLISFDCAGNQGSASDGRTLFSQAQLAYVTQAKVDINVTDSVIFNETVCYANLLFVK